MAGGKSTFFRKISGFVKVLRDADISISTSETLDMFQALLHIPLNDRGLAKQAMQSTLIKDSTDIPLFRKCFEEYFSIFTPGTDLVSELAEFLQGEGETASGTESMAEDLPGMGDMDNTDSLSPGVNNFLQMIMEQLESNVPGEGENIQDSILSIPGVPGAAGGREDAGKSAKEHEDYLLNRYIYNLTAEEIRETEYILRRLGQKLKNRITLRKKRVKRGGLDIKRTLRQSIETGGVPFRLYYRDRKIMRPQLTALCDVSGSVNIYSRFMLLLTSILQGLFSKVRTFAFISSMVEITELFREMAPEAAINSIFSDEEFTYGWGSSYGKCFREFIENYSDSLNRRTTVLVLGDARNNYHDPGLQYFQEIGERCREIIWLNPEKESLWDWGDSIASIYRPYCREMREVNNLLDLSEFVNSMFFNR